MMMHTRMVLRSIQREVTVLGVDLVFHSCTVQVPWVELKFMMDAIIWRFFDIYNKLVNITLSLDKTVAFSFITSEKTSDDLLELTLTSEGMKLFDCELKACLNERVILSENDITLATKVKKPNAQVLEREITSLCDRYKVLWRPFELRNKSGIINSSSCSWRLSGLMESDTGTWKNLIYPRGDIDAVTVTRDDFFCLNPGEFISDTIVDFYIKYLYSRFGEHETESFYFFNSFFFRKLVKSNTEFVTKQTNSRFSHVKRWTKDVNIFQKKYLFIPVLQSAHWSLIIVCYPGHLYKYDDWKEDDLERPSILHFDSMKDFHRDVMEPIERYLLEHWRFTFNLPSGIDTKTSGLKCIRAEVPQQTNFYDCGLYMLHYIEMFLKAYRSALPLIAISCNWFNPEDVASKRNELQCLIKQLQDESEKVCSARTMDSVLDMGACSLVPVHNPSVAKKIDACSIGILEMEDKEIKKVDDSLCMLPSDSDAAVEQDVSVLDGLNMQCSNYCAEFFHGSYLQVKRCAEGSVGNCGKEDSTIADIRVRQSMPFHLSSGRTDLSHIFERVDSIESTDGMQEKQYSVLGTFYRKCGVSEGYSPFINPAIADQIVIETSMKCMCSASVMSRDTLHHCTVSNNMQPMSSCEGAMSKGQINKRNARENSGSFVSKVKLLKQNQTNRLCSCFKLRSDSEVEGLSHFVPEHCEDCKVRVSSRVMYGCMQCATQWPQMKTAYEDIPHESCHISALFINGLGMSPNTASAEECKQSKNEFVNLRLNARGASTQVRQVLESCEPLYVSSDEETDFVKVQKIVNASKARLQNRQISRLHSGHTRNASEGTENQPPNAKWRLRRKSQFFSP
ncbi:hypothetical protein KP509_01G023700 [Ceratopteris richardii]|uniref:Ubiquitin-like protease family profile domain-containing protein n=1 Tax=Ceratopteris richardii TaxID=49495 RepID=A0A8T2VJN1_CERRI|nr:hypothetical protein KP509_01G023700 [Ceratopteris richardii]